MEVLASALHQSSLGPRGVRIHGRCSRWTLLETRVWISSGLEKATYDQTYRSDRYWGQGSLWPFMEDHHASRSAFNSVILRALAAVSMLAEYAWGRRNIPNNAAFQDMKFGKDHKQSILKMT
jgi:hypothetical protein